MRYFLFCGIVDDPSGGMWDYEGGFDTLEEAKAAKGEYGWGQIAILEDGELRVILEYHRPPVVLSDLFPPPEWKEPE